jgi:hypothetical protein
VCWIAWPYYAAYDLATALRDGDSVALENRVAWDSVRQSLRADLNAILLRDVGSNNLAAAIGPAIINQMIEGFVTPQGETEYFFPCVTPLSERLNDPARRVHDNRDQCSRGVNNGCENHPGSRMRICVI